MANQPQIFRYEGPDSGALHPIGRYGGRTGFTLCKSDLVLAGMSVISGGGENELHYHTGNDGFWMVIAGRVKFYGEGDAVIAELGKHEGILIPRGFSYWFGSVGDERLELLHVAAKAQNTEDKNIKPLRAAAP